MRNHTEALAEFALNLQLENLPASTLTATRQVVLDTLGCSIGAIDCEPARIALALDTTAAPGEEATVIGHRKLTGLRQAILVNGILARYLDYGDVYWKRDICHPSELVTVALAAVEARNGSGKLFMESLLASYEGQLRLCDAYSFQAIGMHAISSGGFVTPLAIGRAWGMKTSDLAHAVALNGMRHLTLFGLVKGELSMAKAVGFPLVALEAVDACRLAQAGLTGPMSILNWMFQNLPEGVESDAHGQLDVTQANYRIEAVTLKRYPVQFEIQGAVEAALDARGESSKLAPQDIAKITITTTPGAKERTADPKKYQPANRETADHSLPCCVAMAVLDGKLTAEQFEHDRWRDHDVKILMGKIDVNADAALLETHPDGRPCGVEITLHDGKALKKFIPVPLGDARRPLPPADVKSKFSELASHHMSPARIDEIIAAVGELEHLNRISELTKLLRP